MSLTEAYFLAHSAQCRLKTEASRPDRNLRFLVGHLMHYENMRLRIIQIENESSEENSDSEPIASKNASRVIDELSHEDDDDNPWSDEELDDDQEFDDDEDDGLGLQRFPSAAAQPQHQHIHSDAAPIEPSPEALQQAIQSGKESSAKELYETVRACPCNSDSHAPSIERAWELPSGIAGHEGQRLMVAEVGG